MTHEGGCHCRRVRYRASGAPKFVARCHCDSCRRTTGGAFSTWVGFGSGTVAWMEGSPSFYASSAGVKRGFCPNCGTSLSFQGENWPGETHLLIGTFDEPHAFTPTGDYMKEDALPWAL